jgi:hypothetical protein
MIERTDRRWFGMQQSITPTELILNQSRRSLGHLHLEDMPQPGASVLYEGQTYTVLERRHRYQFRENRYQLCTIALYVQAAQLIDEKSLVDCRWVIGDANCRYNARSELIRCVPNPDGPCRDCRDFVPVES